MTISLRSIRMLMQKAYQDAPGKVQFSREVVEEIMTRLEFQGVELTKNALRNLEEENSIRRIHGIGPRKRLKSKDLQMRRYG